MAKVVPYAMNKWGKKVYILAADYNYGQITAKWIAHYVGQRQGSTLKTDFFPLDVSDFGSTIAKIQQAKPAFVSAALVGGAHLSFFRQWAAAGGDGALDNKELSIPCNLYVFIVRAGLCCNHHHFG